ncbi:MAG: MBOAT family protein [Clostridia bacterium]|nr:MBOAT family protein [Clostridia bacterium]
MLFSSLEFIFLFLPVSLCLYYTVPKRYKNFTVFLSGIIFYAFGEIRLLPLLIVTVLVNFLFGLLIEKFARRASLSRLLLVAAVIFNLALLAYFKYFDFLRTAFFSLDPIGIALPIGISFYTFQALSYVIDVYRREVSATRSFVSFGAYIALFPQLIAGPIVKYSDIERQLKERTESIALFASGLRLFTLGLAKKMLLANPAGEAFESFCESQSYLGALLTLFFFGMQIYFDFSGYSDMAIGLARLFGFELNKNFDYPYISRSVSEFWRRWHISLSSFFKEYLYIPLGGSRRGRARTALNLAIVWTLTGIWHGAAFGFLLWGAYFAVLLIFEKLCFNKLLMRLPVPLTHCYTLFFVFLGWLIFATDGVTLTASEGLSLLSRLFFVGAESFALRHELYIALGLLPFALILALGSTPLPRKIYLRANKKIPVLSVVLPFASLILCVAYSVSSGYNPFLYFRF